MVSMRRNLAMLLVLALSACSLPSNASPIVSEKDLAVPDIAMPANGSSANVRPAISMKHEENEPPLLPNSLTDNMYCEPAPGRCEEGKCANEWYWDVPKSWVLESAKAFCEQVAKDLDGKDNSVGENINYFYHDKMVTAAQSTEGVFRIGLEDAKECKSNNIDRYPSTPVAGFDCLAVTYGAWHQCDNKGQGGAVEAGCMWYSIRPAKLGIF